MSDLNKQIEDAIAQNIQFEHRQYPPKSEPLVVNINGSWIKVHIPYQALVNLVNSEARRIGFEAIGDELLPDAVTDNGVGYTEKRWVINAEKRAERQKLLELTGGKDEEGY